LRGRGSPACSPRRWGEDKPVAARPTSIPFSGWAAVARAFGETRGSLQSVPAWPVVADSIRADFGIGEAPADREIWAAAVDHHLMLVAARNLMIALELEPASEVAIDQAVRDELIEARNLNEHWVENMPTFNVRPRKVQPRHRSGRRYAERNPRDTPYAWWGWSNQTGASVTANVSAPMLHELLDRVEADVLASDPALGRFLLPRPKSEWHCDRGEWWPTGLQAADYGPDLA